MAKFGEATAVSRVADGSYEVDLDPGFGIGEALNGGYVLAVLARAAVDASAHAHPVANSAHFLRVARAGPATIDVEVLKAGRTATAARVTLVQDGATVVDAHITTGTLEETARPRWSGAAPAMPTVEECVAYARALPEGRGDEFADQVEMRFDPATMGWREGRPSGVPGASAYFRLPEPYDPDAYMLALAVDSLPPVVLDLGVSGWAPTVELTWHMRAVPVPGWLGLHGSCRLVSDGWFDEEVEVWDAAGQLVAQSRQIARLGRG